MTGWQLIKETHFAKHGGDGKSWRDPVYGLQATKSMAKLSLLVLLDGEARDMDEFELDLLGEKWCYVTVCLIGKVRTIYILPRIETDDVEGRRIAQIIIDTQTNSLASLMRTTTSSSTTVSYANLYQQVY